ncbi:membrane protein CcdC involved in cytochrome C biogenesis [Paenibacillus forsythiae]|uniref:Membrane protein CcdC involved in cytochrome C biogenesis n=1 Tax=Paenibacillus forsythiae TaxID=365616 RepID=A0ABU3HBH9_9BACL|nr:cytochrome c biogenesis protein CcdC [Paenibacillus forsythiae]MDT3428170.1 membrane protein CcdC involved in cytochrome C biogenesis [Paenibacillus forsythiae]
MGSINPSLLHIGSSLGAMLMALMVIFIRLKASDRPVTLRKILIPPLGMSTGFIMFVVPETRVPLWWALAAFLAGWFVLAYPLIKTTSFHEKEGLLYVRRSKSFILVLLGLFLVRTLLHEFIDRYISIPQSGGLFFILAFGMIVRWRMFMFRTYRRLVPPEAHAAQ